jgi:hypothetical protein
VLLSLDEGTYFSLNDVGAIVWTLCDGSHTVEDIIDALCAEFEAPPERIGADVVALVDDLASEGLVGDAV